MRVLAVCLALVSSACLDLAGADLGRYVERQEQHFSVGGRPDVAVSTFDGAVEVRVWDRPDVEVVVEKHASSRESAATIAVEAQQSGNHVSVDVRVPRQSGFHLSRSAKLIVLVPAAADLTAKSGDGSIDVERIHGRLDLHSGDGTIKARSIDGDVTVSTGDGSIDVTGAIGALRARSGDGSITIAASGGDHAGDWEIDTGDGSVTLSLPKTFGAELDAHTGDGGVRLEDVSVSNVNGEIRRNRVKGRLGEGGRALRIRTGDGSITLRSARPSETGGSR